jgi:hypothetical protein
MHRGTGLNGAAGPVSGALVMIVGTNRGSSTDLYPGGEDRRRGELPSSAGGSPDRGMPAVPEVSTVSSRIP